MRGSAVTKILTTMLAFVLVLGAMTFPAFALTNGEVFYEPNANGKLIWYKVVGIDKVEVTRAVNDYYTGDISVPDVVGHLGDTYSIIGVKENAFSDFPNLNSVQLGLSIEYISENAFHGSAITEIGLPNSLKTIRDSAFAGCTKLASLIVPDSVAAIGNNAFDGCMELKTIDLGNGLQSLGDYAFRHAIIQEIEIPASLTNIGVNPFASCHKLKTITVDGANPTFVVEQDLLIEEATRTIWACPAGLLTVAIPHDIKHIADSAFYGCEYLEALLFHESLETVGDRAFFECKRLNKIYFYGNKPTFGNEVFMFCNADLTVYYSGKQSGWADFKGQYPLIPLVNFTGGDTSAIVSGGGGISSGGSGGGGGGGSRSSSAATSLVANNTYWIEKAEAQKLAGAAVNGVAHSQKIGSVGIRGDALAALGEVKFVHDSVLDSKVIVRLSISDPSIATGDLLISGSLESASASVFTRWFSNKTVVVSMEQQGSFGQTVQIAARADLSDMNTNNLFFYSYDKKLNQYTRITAPAYHVDKNGYVHFSTSLAGDILISDGALARN